MNNKSPALGGEKRQEELTELDPWEENFRELDTEACYKCHFYHSDGETTFAWDCKIMPYKFPRIAFNPKLWICDQYEPID